MSDKAIQKDNSERESQTEPSADGAVLVFLSKKLERITSALYLVTNSLPVEEPLRHSIREKSLQLLSATFSLAEQAAVDAVTLVNSIQATVREVKALLHVARNAHLISEMNYQVLEREFSALLDVTDSKLEPVGHPELNGSYFQVESLSFLPTVSSRGGNAPSQSGTVSAPPGTIRPRSAPILDGEPVTGIKERRRQAILDIIKDRGRVTIKDISRLVQGCSRKTIQRELLSLVEEGVITKEGERRWSTYALA
jgi:hypothetical protein